MERGRLQMVPERPLVLQDERNDPFAPQPMDGDAWLSISNWLGGVARVVVERMRIELTTSALRTQRSPI